MLDLNKNKLEIMMSALWNKIINKFDNYYTKSDVDEIIANGNGGFSVCEWHEIDNVGFSLDDQGYYTNFNGVLNSYITFAISVPYDIETKITIKENRFNNVPYKIVLNSNEIFKGSSDVQSTNDYTLQLKKGINTLEIHDIHTAGSTSSYYLSVYIYKVVV